MTIEETPTTWLTQEAYDSLKAELDNLIESRPAVAAEINARREEGDLRENGGYHAAREEQGKQEGRIRQLTALLENAQVGQAPTSTDEVTAGTVVTIYFDGDKDDAETFLLGSREIAASTGVTAYSPESPMGQAIVGKKVGEEATYDAPNGGKISVTVAEIKPFTG